MSSIHGKKRFLACLAVAALLVLQTAAFAHEIEHDLEQHDDPTCALHLYTSHAGKTMAADEGPVVTAAPTFYAALVIAHPPRIRYVLGYRGRAPPLPVSVVS